MTVHRVAELRAVDVERDEPPAVTSPARTIVDLATVLPWPELRAIADRVRSLDIAAIRAAQSRAPQRPGASDVRRLCGRLEAHTKSEFERRYLRFRRRHGIASPESVDMRVAGVMVDCRYGGRRLVVELDGRASATSSSSSARGDCCEIVLRGPFGSNERETGRSRRRT